MRNVWKSRILTLSALAVVTTGASQADAQDCNSSNPADWPAAAKPYFMLVVDTSGSMAWSAAANSCKIANGFSSNYPDTRSGALRCAMTKVVKAFGGQVNFGLASFGKTMTGCSSATCYDGCSYNGGDCAAATILVPMDKDPLPTTSTPNIDNLLAYCDNNCSDSRELFANGATPIGDSLAAMRTYFASSYGGNNTPLSSADPSCRYVAVILLTDGDETCSGNGVTSAASLWTGVTFGTKTFQIRTHVIDATNANPSQANLDIAAAGHGLARGATSEAALSQAYADILSDAIMPEVCDNVDNNCNGCVDEGYKHYCNRNRTGVTNPTNDSQCCSAARATCIANYKASITTTNPTGNRWLLPCYTPPTASLGQPLGDSTSWLCYNPGDNCDNLDNNCDGTTPNASTADENIYKCNGTSCPTAETCNGLDDNCDGIKDNAAGSSTPFSLPGCSSCSISDEICDGVDNDCDGTPDDNITPLTCGLPTPSNCVGQLTCVGGSWSTCSNHPVAETCNGADDDCNGLIDDNVAATPCDVPNTSGLVYQDSSHPDSQCVRGLQPCNGVCAGYVGPTSEICDGKDNDCNGLVDDFPAGVGQICGVVQGICTKGTTSCESGVLVCKGGTQPQAEICDGIDNDCNGFTDDGNLLDAPDPANKPCWGLPGGSCTPACSYTGSTNTIEWCPPPGANCHDTGSLASPPCATGNLVCQGGGWKCAGGKAPETESCDSVDNDCNGTPDDNLPTLTCGTDQGECSVGTQYCDNGVVQCVGAVGPQPEKCDGLDNDCDGTADNGIALGTPCTPTYDTALYPGDRTKGECKPGVTECGAGGVVECKNGVGPKPEVCDGLDNDCDGTVDEPGASPDGLDGTANPANPGQVLGQPCGTDVGACEFGEYKCIAAQFVCSGGKTPQPETCNCEDDDCDGKVDEDPVGSGDPQVCASGKACVAYAGGCQCAAPCGSGEFKCPTGAYSCETVDKSGTEPPESAGGRCVTNPCPDCWTQTVTSSGAVECAPAGTTTDAGVSPPVCVCKGQAGCHKPCYGVSCTAPQVCTDYGANAGKCVEDNCWQVPCASGQVCDQGQCKANPCKADTCKADEVCKPSSDFSKTTCVKSCATIQCTTGQTCVDGTCTPTGCSQDCPTGQVCGDGGCVESKCAADTCSNGSYCDPITGACGNFPCEGVLCPSGQECVKGQCELIKDSGTTETGAGGSTHDSGKKDGNSAESSGASGATNVQPTEDRGNWGLATGGGGCACSNAGLSRTTNRAAVGLGLLLFGLIAARRSRAKENQ